MVKKRLYAILQTESLVDHYLEKFGPVFNLHHILDIQRRSQQIEESPGPKAVKEVGSKGEDPVYDLKVQCPICKTKNISFLGLKAKSQAVKLSKFNIPIYEGTSQYRKIDYNRISVTVCPTCLFASPDKKDFNFISSYTQIMSSSQIPRKVVISIKEQITQRKSRLPENVKAEEYFNRFRNQEASILSYELSQARAMSEAYHDNPNALYKLGAYSLKIAQLVKTDSQDDTPHLEEAKDFFEECFSRSNCTSESLEYQVIYLLVALFIRLGNLTKARTYLGSMDKIISDMRLKNKATLEGKISEAKNWDDRMKRLWEDRNQAGLFDQPR